MISGLAISRVAALVAAGAVLWAGVSGSPDGAQENQALAAHKLDIQRMTADGGVMITSNARYQAEDNGTTHYGQYFEAIPGGLDARGCLWGERDGEVVGVYWYFFSGWDPAEGAGFFYQSSPGGGVGFGYGGPIDDDEHWAEQRFSGPGLPPRIRHENRWFATDSVTTRTFEGEIEGELSPRRVYTWIRQQGRTPPC